MSDFLERLEQQLVSARPPRRRPGRRAIAIVGLVTVLVSGPALAATQPWKPLIGDERRGSPPASAGGPPQAQLDGLAVLRRPQGAADRAGVALEALRLTDDNVSGVRTGWVRVLRSTATEAALVPVERFNLRSSKMIRPDMSARLRHVLALKRDGLCVFVPEPAGDGGGYGCNTWEEIKGGQLPSSLGPTLYGLVPDGVARVEVEFTDAPALSAGVRENFYAARAPQARADEPPRLLLARWLAADGSVLKEIRAPQRARRLSGAG